MGITGEVGGPSKIAAYLKYAEWAQDFGDTFHHDPPPHNKKLCKKRMIQDPVTGEWVLYYHLHT